MGMLIDGQWHDVGYDTASTKGRFVRSESQFRNWITRDGSAGPTGDAGFKAEPGRYHLYVSLACPWAHRALIFRKLKGLEDMIGISCVHWYMGSEGWTFRPGPGVVADSVFDKEHLYEIYLEADPHYTGRVTTPTLFDKKRNTVVSNESADIIRMFNSAFDEVGANADLDYYPEDRREEIDQINSVVYSNVNNGVYKAGFATTQDAYEEAVTTLFDTLDDLDRRLSTQRYLTGSRATEADWRLFPTLLRFDPVYFGHFKCNKRRVVDFPNLWGYTCDLYQTRGIPDTVNLDVIKMHYYGSHLSINPYGIVPIGPEIDYSVPHNRDHL